MPNQRNRNLSPEEQEKLLKEYEKKKFAEIEKETKREIFIERYKDKIFKYSRWGFFILIFILVFTVVVNIVVPRFIIKPPPIPPTPTPKDPRESFKVTVEKTKLLAKIGKENSYDVLVQIANQNPFFGASKLNYKLILKDFLGNVVGERSGESYILPQQSRYLIEIGIPTQSKAEKLEVLLQPKEIQKLKQFENPQFQIKISDQNSIVADQKTKVFANFSNISPFGFEKVDVNFVLYDAHDIVGINYTNFDAFVSGSTRQVQTTWDYIIPAKISRVEIEPNVNVFESGVFMERYGEGQVLEY